MPRSMMSGAAGAVLVLGILTLSRPVAAQSEGFSAGLRERATFESWLGSLSEDARNGAEYWAGQRSLPTPGSCYPPEKSAAWKKACAASQVRLDPADTKRKTNPDYRAGWNSYGAPPAASPPPERTGAKATLVDRLREAAGKDCRVALPRYPVTDPYGRTHYETGPLSPEAMAEADRCETAKQDAARALPGAQRDLEAGCPRRAGQGGVSFTR